MQEEIKQDLWQWITDYIEVNHKFYDYKFPPCPYAKSARVKGLVDIVAYESGNINDFIQPQVNDLIAGKKYNVRIMAFPARFKWYWQVKNFIVGLNNQIVPNDFYIQYGTALKTQCRYPGWFNSGPYFIVIVNKLSDVIAGHKALLSTDYYKSWAPHHYDAVVSRRQEMYKKYHK